MAQPKQEPLTEDAFFKETMTTKPDGSLEFVPADYWKGSKLPKWLQWIVTDWFIFTLIHYNLWLAPFVFLFFYLIKTGYTLVVVALVVLYLPSFLDGSQKTANGRQWDFVRTLPIWHASARLLNLKVIREAPLDSAKKYIFGFHPHGIIVLSRISTYGGVWEQLFPKINYRALGASTMFYVPLGRELCLWLGGVDASRSTAEKVLKSGKSIVVYPGGVPEIFLVDPKSKENVLVIKKRLGFIKLAMRQGADLVPVFVFGEKWLYKVWTPPKKVIDFFRKTLQIPMIIFWGRFLWMPNAPPKGKSFGVVYGKPMALKQVEHPTDEEVKEVHDKYVAEVERLFNQYKKSFGYDDDETLVIS